MVSLVWAMDENGLIGKDNKLPWRVPADLKRLKELTHNKTALMGHNTYISMKTYYKDKQMPFKKIYVYYNTFNELEDAQVVVDLHKFVKSWQNEEELFIIGGAYVYEETFKYADRLYMTRIFGKYEGDKYFHLNEIPKDQFMLIEHYQLKDCAFYTYRRKRK